MMGRNDSQWMGPVNQDSINGDSPGEAIPEVRLGRREIRIFLVIVLIVSAYLGLAFWFSLPATVDEYAWRGLLRLSRERYEAAADDFSAAIALAREERKDSEIPGLLVQRAVCSNNSGRYQWAVDDVTRALSLVSEGKGPLLIGLETTEWYLIRANAHFELGELEHAIADAEVVLRNEPGNELARKILGRAEERMSADNARR